MNGLVLCGTGPHYTVAFYALHVADAGRPWDQTLLSSPTCKGEQYNTMHHDTLALQKPWSHTPTHTVHIPQHRHLHTNTHVTNITNGNTSLTVWEKNSIHQHLNSESGTAFGWHFYDGCLLRLFTKRFLNVGEWQLKMNPKPRCW